MTGVLTITDEDLVAYLDGELGPQRRSEIDAALKHDEHLRARLAELDIDKDAIRTVFDRLLTAAPMNELRVRREEANARSRPAWRLLPIAPTPLLRPPPRSAI